MDDSLLFWTQAAAVGQIAGAIATFFAVIISLWIVVSERRESLRLSVGHRLIIGGGAPEIEVISFEVTNIGLRPVRVTGFGWRSGWSPRGPAWLTYRWAIQMNDTDLVSQYPPFDLEPGHKANFLVKLSRFQDRNAAKDDLLERRVIPLVGSVTPKICGLAYTARGTRVIAKVEPPLYKEFAAIPEQDNGNEGE